MDETSLAERRRVRRQRPKEMRLDIEMPVWSRRMAILRAKTYRQRHGGTLLVLGSGPGVRREFRRVSRQRPSAMVMLIGHAAGLFAGDFIVSDHYEAHPTLRRLQDEFCAEMEIAPRYTTHCAKASAFWRWSEIDYWWDFPRSAGTSLETALRIALIVGFDEIIVCGCPMVKARMQHPVQIVKDGPTWPPPRDVTTFGLKTGHNTSDEILARFREGLVAFVNKNRREIEKRVRAMSGFTMELFGRPDIRN